MKDSMPAYRNLAGSRAGDGQQAQPRGEIAGAMKTNIAVWPSWRGSRLGRMALGLADQGFSAGGMFLVNVSLARTQSKEDFGTFALSYSIFTFLAALHNSAVLEPYTVYGAGRYQNRFSAYSRLMRRSNAIVGAGLSLLLLLACLLLRWIAPQVPTRSLFGLGLALSIILSAGFLRRGFYLERKPASAATMSLAFFTAVALLLWLAVRTHHLDNFSVFLIVAMAWLAAAAVAFPRHASAHSWNSFLATEPGYWREHWKYSRWVLAMTFIFQFMHQGYYWMVAGFLSVPEVGELKAMYLLIAPVELAMISLSFLVLPSLTAKYAGGNRAGFFSLLQRYVCGMLVVAVLFALTVRLAGRFVMHVLYAGKFDSSSRLLFPLALVPLATAVGIALSDALRAAERPRLNFFAYVGSALATVLLGIPLVIHFGLPGAVYGMLLSGAAFAGALALLFWRHISTQPAAGAISDAISSPDLISSGSIQHPPPSRPSGNAPSVPEPVLVREAIP